MSFHIKIIFVLMQDNGEKKILEKIQFLVERGMIICVVVVVDFLRFTGESVILIKQRMYVYNYTTVSVVFLIYYVCMYL